MWEQVKRENVVLIGHIEDFFWGDSDIPEYDFCDRLGNLYKYS